MTKGELKKLFLIIDGSEKEMATLESGGGDVGKVVPKVRAALHEFVVAAGEYGLKGLSQVGQKLEKYASMPSLSAEHLTTLAFALGLIRRGLQEGTAESIRSSIVETLEILGVELMDVSVPYDKPDKTARKKEESSWMPKEVKPEPAPAEEQKASKIAQETQDVSKVSSVASRLGGKILPSEGDSDDSLKLEIPKDSLEKIGFLISPYDSEDPVAQQLGAQDPTVEKVLKNVKEFMASFAGGDLIHAQEILQELSSMQGDGEMYNEIGSLARELHNSLRNLSATLDPGLKELVEDSIPDSGDRLEHILHLTESAANTTLDHAERIQNRSHSDQERLAHIEKHLAMLKPIGETARMRMEENARIVSELKSSLSQTIEDLTVILTSQGYQDLAGQVILKMVNFHKDLETKLIGLVRTFGVTVNKEKKKKDELYGPAHEKMEGALHSQDEIDSLLAEFGF